MPNLISMTPNTSLVILPDTTSQMLIPRTFEISLLDNTYKIVESVNNKTHKISKDLVEELSSVGFEDEEICELFVFIHEVLAEWDVRLKHEHIANQLRDICLRFNNPVMIINNFKSMTYENLVKVMNSKDAYNTYLRLTSLDVEDDYSDGNHEKGD